MSGVISAVGIGLGASAASAAAVGAMAVGGLAVAGAGLGYSIASGEDAKRKQANALTKQENAQKQAVNAAEGQRKQSEMAINQANRQTPNVAGIMQAASKDAESGTMLTGPTGVDPNALSLGKSTLLGG